MTDTSAKVKAMEHAERSTFMEKQRDEGGRTKESKKRRRDGKSNPLQSPCELELAPSKKFKALEAGADSQPNKICWESVAADSARISQKKGAPITYMTRHISLPGYEVHTMSILTSTKMQTKIARALELLAPYAVGEKKKTKGHVLVLRARARAATKMISIVEIVKREISAKQGKWFQYNVLDKLMEEKKLESMNWNGNGAAVGKGHATRDKAMNEEKKGVEEEEGEEGEEEDGFEIMKTPFERAIEDVPKVRGVPVMSIYLSRVRLENLKAGYGEQTNASAKLL